MRANQEQKPEWLTSEILSDLSNRKINGREIKNIVRTGYALARHEKRDMRSADLILALDAMEQFENDFNDYLGQKKGLEASSEPSEGD